LEEVVVYVRIILKRILRKWNRSSWTGFVWLRIPKIVEVCLKAVMNSQFR
jgi:hypothetical protein